MKFLATILVTLALIISSEAAAQKRTITVTVENATSDVGKIEYALYDEDSFMKKPIQAKQATIENGKSVIVFESVPMGEYAITCYHDKNSNGRMDFLSNGMPAEDYGASNNNMSFGPPQYNDAKFLVTYKNVSLKIRF